MCSQNSFYEPGQSWRQVGHFDICGFTDMILCGVEIGKDAARYAESTIRSRNIYFCNFKMSQFFYLFVYIST
jgi:hypothetical protein